MDLELPKPRLVEPYPDPKEIPYDSLLDFAPFETLKEYYPCPPAGISRNLMTEDIQGGQANQFNVQDPKDPMCLNKPFPDIWLLKPDGKVLKPSRTLVTNRLTNPLDPQYILPSGPSNIPAGFHKWTNRTSSMALRNDDIVGSRSKSLYAKPCRCILPGEKVPDPWKGCKSKKWTWMRNRMFYGTGLELFDIDIGKKHKGFTRQKPSNPLEPIYPTEPEETPETKHRRLKLKRIPPRRRKTNPCEKALDTMYWKAEQLPAQCRLNGEPQPKDNAVTYDAFRYTMETFGLYLTDDEFNRFKPYIDPDNTGSVRYLNLSKQLRHNDGFQIDIPKPLGFDMGYWGMPSCLGQGLNVLEYQLHRGKKTSTWEEHRQIYNPLTGNPVPVWTHKPMLKPLDAGLNNKSPWEYNYLEVVAKMQDDARNKERSQYEYSPTGPVPPHKKLNVEPPGMPVRQISLASSGVNQRPEWCQHWDSLAEKDLAMHTCEKPVEKTFNLAAVEMAQQVGALVRRNTAQDIRNRQESMLPTIHQPLAPTSTLRGSRVNWQPVVPASQKFMNKLFIPQNVRSAHEARLADIETVKSLQVID
ncbi:uncharacterized protein [Physcomitrium patens]|uniref:Uncharacterized protein n=1 Tax=Physcomitrium patens TaxID=3218 RepID=A0A2K1L2C3_PHYPA|nr:uncharacterized protein LOC112295012 isoform X1 [Physcomitrium patens]XP_024401878.1 uncharacterized protein LOC112295012 isoform X1 [Physcomitrium patens]PNR60178.1 hypothetical protein PHYPA_002971 [Physcomitrium patens]|eukprot:XP_024401869.1 uncharacterized protein LOC112295012 isoform X1 [Physcomitrella patens]